MTLTTEEKYRIIKAAERKRYCLAVKTASRKNEKRRDKNEESIRSICTCAVFAFDVVLFSHDGTEIGGNLGQIHRR